MNPMNIIQQIRNGANPQQIVLSMLEEQMGNTPMGANLLSLAKNNNYAGIEQVARNILQQRGINFDQAFASFRQNLGL